MPRELTHIILADNISQSLDNTALKDIENNRIAYHMGSNAPDILFYGSSKKQGEMLHGKNGEDTSKMVVSMLDEIRKEKDAKVASKKRAFVYGYLCHMAADITFHPYVFSVAGNSNSDDPKERLQSGARHALAETWLDIHFVKRSGHNFDNFKPFHKINRSIEDKNIISEFFATSFKNIYPTDKPIAHHFRRNTTRQLYANRITRNHTIRDFVTKLDDMFGQKLLASVAFVYRTDRKAPDELTNFTSFTHPLTAETINKNLDVLVKETVTRGNSFIIAAEQYLKDGNRTKLHSVIKGENLATGIAKTKNKDMKHFNPMSLKKLKGEKVKAFAGTKSLRAMPSGAKAFNRSEAKLAYPVIQRVIPNDIEFAKPASNQAKQASSNAIGLAQQHKFSR